MKELSIPERISMEKEIFNIRQKDIKKLIALTLPGAIIGITFGVISDNPMMQVISMVLTMGYLFLCYVVTARVEGNPSILNYIELLIRFRREQQRFYYKQGKENLYYVSDTSADGSPDNDGSGIY